MMASYRQIRMPRAWEALRCQAASGREPSSCSSKTTRTHADAPWPSLILLDLNLPIRNGLEVLAELKGDTKSRSIPIVVLTTSQAPNDIEQCYSLHANAYIVKPSDFDGFADVIKQIATCFLGLISLPL
jgi:CheY-like chemotaxis protein